MIGPIYKFDACPPGICPRGMRVQLGEVQESSIALAATVGSIALFALSGAVVGAPAGAVVAGRGRRARGALVGAGVGAGVNLGLGLLLAAIG